MYNKQTLYRIALLILSLSLSACSSDGEERPEYLDSYSLSGLEIPPQLTGPDGSNELLLPQPSDKAMMLFKQRDGMEGKAVAPVFKGVALKSDQAMYWLEFEQNADQLWPMLRNFWAHEGIELERDEPLLGLMETGWIKEYQSKRDTSFLKRVFNMLSADFVDKFRLRVERVNAHTSRVYISHRGLEKVLLEEDGTRWQSRGSEPALEKEMYYRLALFAGMSEVQADDMFAVYVPYQSRIRVIDENQGSYEVIGQSDFVWQRLLRALDRLGVEILQQDKAQGQVSVKVIAARLPVEEKEPEVTGESGWIWSDPSQRDTTTPVVAYDGDEKDVNVKVSLQPSQGNTRMLITDAEGQTITGGLAWQFKSGLAAQLK